LVIHVFLEQFALFVIEDTQQFLLTVYQPLYGSRVLLVGETLLMQIDSISPQFFQNIHYLIASLE